MLCKYREILSDKVVGFWMLVNVAVAALMTFQVVRLIHPPQPETTIQPLEAITAAANAGTGVGQPAPDFSLPRADGSGEVSLRSFRGKKPVVLIFGSYSCPVFRRRAAALNEAYEQFQEEAEFLVIYTREAHPVESGRISENFEIGLISAPTSLEQRSQLALTCAAHLDLQMPVLVDDMASSTEQKYQSWPERIYVVSASGAIAFAGYQLSDANVPAIATTLNALREHSGAE